MSKFKNQINDVIAMPAAGQKDMAASVLNNYGQKKNPEIEKNMDKPSQQPVISTRFQDRVKASRAPEGKGNGPAK